MCVVESASEKVALAGVVQCEQSLEAVARLGCLGIGEQVHFAGEPRERGHHGAAPFVFHHELRNEDGIGYVRERIVEGLLRVHAAQGVQIGFFVLANEHDVV